jgi:hypothetical protein
LQSKTRKTTTVETATQSENKTLTTDWTLICLPYKRRIN